MQTADGFNNYLDWQFSIFRIVKQWERIKSQQNSIEYGRNGIDVPISILEVLHSVTSSTQNQARTIEFDYYLYSRNSLYCLF